MKQITDIVLLLLLVMTRYYLGRYDGKIGIWRFHKLVGWSENMYGKTVFYCFQDNILQYTVLTLQYSSFHCFSL